MNYTLALRMCSWVARLRALKMKTDSGDCAGGGVYAVPQNRYAIPALLMPGVISRGHSGDSVTRPRAALRLPFLLFTITLAVSAGPAHANHDGTSQYQGFAPSISVGSNRTTPKARGSDRRTRRGISAGDAAAIVRQSGSKVLGVKQSKGKYRVKTLTPNGRVRDVLVDPRTGALVR